MMMSYGWMVVCFLLLCIIILYRTFLLSPLISWSPIAVVLSVGGIMVLQGVLASSCSFSLKQSTQDLHLLRKIQHGSTGVGITLIQHYWFTPLQGLNL